MTSEATWPVEFADFKRLDTVLKCGICYDYMTNSMITSCSHTYCSLCIRKFMQYKNQCPACFEETYEVHLRNNRPLDEVISIFIKMKDKLQRALRLATIPIPIKESKPESAEDSTPATKTPNNKITFQPKTPSFLRGNTPSIAMCLFKEKPEDSCAPSGSVTPTSTPRDASMNSSQITAKTGDDVVLNGVKIPGIFNAPVVFPKIKKPEEMAICPVCQVEVPARNINMHLDSCLAVESEVRQKQTKPVKKRDPLPKRLYHLMQEKGLKKILKELGLGTHGDRKTLIARIQRYTVIYNAENDSPSPRPVTELIAQLEREEREEKKPTSLMKSMNRQQPRPTVDRKAGLEAIEEVNKAYRDENKENFRKLIEEMRMREGRNIKPTKPPPRVYSDDEDDPNRSNQFNPDVPTTSKEDSSAHCYDSDSDIFQENEEETSHSKGIIDWERTRHIVDDECIISSESDDDSETGTTTDPPEQEPPSPGYSEITANCNPQSQPSSPNPVELLGCRDENQSEPPSLPKKVAHINAIDKTSTPELRTRQMTPDSDTGEAGSQNSDDSIDALFENSKTYNEDETTATPRITRSSKKCTSAMSTPLSSDNRGLKRKSNESPKSSTSNLQETFDYLFEKYNGDKVDSTVESDDNEEAMPKSPLSSGCAQEADASTPSPRRTRGSTKGESRIKVANTNCQPHQKVTRKRAKRDLSPAF